MDRSNLHNELLAYIKEKEKQHQTLTQESLEIFKKAKKLKDTIDELYKLHQHIRFYPTSENQPATVSEDLYDKLISDFDAGNHITSSEKIKKTQAELYKAIEEEDARKKEFEFLDKLTDIIKHD